MLLPLLMNNLLSAAAVAEPAAASTASNSKVRRREIFTAQDEPIIATGRNPRRRVERLLLARVI